MPDSFTVVQWTWLPRGEATPAFCERVEALLGVDLGARASPARIGDEAARDGRGPREITALAGACHRRARPRASRDRGVFYLRTFDLHAESEALAAHLADRFQTGSYLRGYLALCRGRIEEAPPTLKDCPVGRTHRLFWGPAFDPWREDPRFQRAIADAPFAAEYKSARATLARMLDQPAKK